MNELADKLTELEIRLAFQDELLHQLNDTIVQMHQTLDLQQAQLRWLYDKLQQNQVSQNEKPYRLADEIPPHY